MAVKDFTQCSGLRDLAVHLLDDMSQNAQAIFEAISDNLDGFITGRIKIPNTVGAESGFYTEEHFEAALVNLKTNRINVIQPTEVSGNLDYLSDPIAQNFVEYKDPQKFYDKISEKSFKEFSGAKGYMKYQLIERESDITLSLEDAGDVDYNLNDTVLKDPRISDIVRAALVYEHASYGHEPWRKTHLALGTPDFVAALSAAPKEAVTTQ